MELVTINEGEFYHIIANTSPVVVNFSANWCGRCRESDKLVCEFAEQNPELPVYRLDVEESTDVANRFKVANVPSVVMFKNGTALKKLEENITAQTLSDFYE